MKKLMIAAAIVCAAAFAQAATCTWETGWVFAVDTDNPTYMGETETSAGSYWILALDSASAADTIKVNEEGAITFGEGATLYGSKGSYADGVVAGGIAGLSAANNGDLYALVVFDENYKYYGVAISEVDGIVDENLEANPPVHGADGAMTFMTFDDEGLATVWADTKAEAVPEPTTGLLMLLGMAGLALRRRRA